MPLPARNARWDAHSLHTGEEDGVRISRTRSEVMFNFEVFIFILTLSDCSAFVYFGIFHYFNFIENRRMIICLAVQIAMETFEFEADECRNCGSLLFHKPFSV